MYDYAILIGRFQPVHAGHIHVIKQALEQSQKLIIVLGGARASRSARNPLTADERAKMISDSLPKLADRIEFIPQMDYLYNDAKWLATLRSSIATTIFKQWTAGPTKIALVGHSKDRSSYYLKLFPEWDSIEVSNYKGLDATPFRESLLEDNFNKTIEKFYDHFASDPHFEVIRKTFQSQDLDIVREELAFVKKYKKQWEAAPYPPIFVTVDAVITQSGNILLVERGDMPGRGLWALPGGFLEQDERIENGIIRECKEETKIKVPDSVWERGPELIKVYDHPYRSQRGRTITHAGLYNLRDDTSLPKVKGSDDAKKAFWCPIENVTINRELFFEDHSDIITDILSL